MTEEIIWNEVRKNIAEILPSVDVNGIKSNDRLVDLGANSVDRVEIVTLTLEGLNLTIPPHELAKANNLGDLVEILLKKASL
ncbi:MAG: acyl carrier protein [Blastocatellia bacterium]|nr:acyl carrier protein [Blastocatellia bacterium]